MFKKKVYEAQTKLLDDIKRLVAHPSVRDLESKEAKAPFGMPIRLVMDEFIAIAQDLGFTVEDHDGYAVSATLGNHKEHLGILGHLDVVGITSPNEWESDPFEMVVKNGNMFGRGVNDDKGPLMAALYAAKIVYETNPNLKRSIKVIAGGAEETTWEGVDYYFKENPQPDLGFSPDGNFPIVNGEMGILQLQLTFNQKTGLTFSSSPEVNYLCYELSVNGKRYNGDKHLSRNPQRGKNAIFEFIKSNDYDSEFKETDLYRFLNDYLLDDIEAHRLNLATTHDEMLPLRVCAMSLNSKEDKEILNLDFRYPINIEPKVILKVLEELAASYDYKMDVIRDRKPLYVHKDSELIQKLQRAYETVMEEPADVLTKGGASYARILENGVAFGATFDGEDPRPHMSNETMPVQSLLKACEIYCEAIYELTKK